MSKQFKLRENEIKNAVLNAYFFKLESVYNLKLT